MDTVDYGTALPEAEDELAKEALVFMVSGMSGHWKHPKAYVLQNSCSAAVHSELIKDCIALLYAEKLKVVAVVFDGTYANQSSATGLGCEFKVSQMKTWFPQPEDEALKVQVIFDICHMLTLMRNLQEDYKVICHEKNNELHKIKWSYIEALNDVQEDLGFSLENKLRKKHIMWTKHKMNVSLAAQTLSSSVAKAIDFLCDEVDIPIFAESEATTDFIKKVDMDLQNWMTKCDELASYIFALKDDRGR